MADLKAAAKWLRETAGNYLTPEERAYNETAAQALEALAWQGETGAGVRRKFTGNCWKWACYAPGGRSWFEYVADTPLGAILAAMEGERDGKEN